MNIQHQYAALSKHIRNAKSAKERAILEAQRRKLKPGLQAYHAGKTVTEAAAPKQQQESRQQPLPIAFNFYLLPASQRAAVFVDRVYAKWLESGHKFYRPISDQTMRDYRKILEVMTANLGRSIASGNKNGVRIRREERMYRTASRYRPDVFDKKTLTVLDDLDHMHLADQVKGDTWIKNPFDRSQIVDKEYHQTRLLPTKELSTIMSELSVDSILDFEEVTDKQEVIIQKRDESSTLVEYTDDEITIKYRAQMRIINDMLANAGPLVTPEVRGMSLGIDERERFLVRRFTYSSLESGGRLWGGFWMDLKKSQRPHILRINGQKTAECDYSTLVARLAYAYVSEGIEAVKPPKGDLYTIPGLSPESRDGVKRLFSTLLFDQSKNRDRFPKGVAELFSIEDQRKGFKQVLELVKAHHAAITPLFGTGVGHYLQFLESQLLVNVLLGLANEKIVALPLHDCVVVEARKAEQATFVMEATALQLIGTDIPVSVKGGLSHELVGGRAEDKPTTRPSTRIKDPLPI